MRFPLLIAVAVLLAGFSASATAAVARDWIRPIDGEVLRAFSVGSDRFAPGQHRGVDLAAPPGARVLAACGGRVSFAGRVPRGGRTVSVQCGSLIATYQHLGSVAVARGQVVMAGGRIGRAGRARPAPHVHLGARVAATGEYRDPLTLFAGGPSGPLAPVPALRRGPPAAPTPWARPRAPAPAPARRPVPVALGPDRAPVRGPEPVARGPARAPVPAAAPVALGPSTVRRFGPVAAPAPGASADRLPWAVWLGLACVALGVPLGGGLVAARRRRSAPDAAGRPAFSTRVLR